MSETTATTIQLRYHHGSWTLFFNNVPRTVKARGRLAYSLKLRREKEDRATAQDILTIVRAQLLLGVPFQELSCFKNPTEVATSEPQVTCRAVAEQYFVDKTTIEDTTMAKTKHVWKRWIEPTYGDRAAASIETGDIIQLISTIVKAGCKRSYAQLVVRRWSSIWSWGIPTLKLRDATGRRLLNPCIDSALREHLREDKALRRGGSKRRRAFLKEHVETFLAVCLDRLGYEAWFFWLTMFRLGVRVGEAMALELSDFRFVGTSLTVFVHQTWTQNGRHEQRKNVRDLFIAVGKIFPSYVEEARRYCAYRERQNRDRGVALPWAFPRDHADPENTGRKRRIDCPVSYRTVWGHFNEILKAAGLPRHTPHDTRHTVAVQLLDLMKNPRPVAAYLGDSVQTIVRFYLEGGEVDWDQYAGIGDQLFQPSGGTVGPHGA